MKILYSIFTLSCLIFFFECSNSKKTIAKNNYAPLPVAQKVFTDRPFGFDPSVKNFRENIVPPYKEQAYTMKNKHNPDVIDTIYRFYRKKSEFFIYKTKQGRELFFAGNIYDNKIKLYNGVKIGMYRGAFFNCFTDLKFNNNDTVIITSDKKAGRYKFIFINDKLSVIKIENYID